MTLRSQAAAQICAVILALVPMRAISAPASARVVLDSPGASARERQASLGSIEQGLARHGWGLADDATQSTASLKVRIRVSADTHRIEFTLKDSTGTAHVQSAATCEICGLSELEDLIADRSADLIAQYETDQEAAPVLHVTTTPKHAQVFVDGRLEGMSNAEVELSVGDHLVEVRATGYVQQSRTVSLARGTQREIHLRLAQRPPEPGTTTPSSPGRGVSISGGATLAFGLAGVGVGATLIAMDGSPIQRGCNPDPNGNCARIHNTSTGGAVALALGVAGLATGVTLLAIGRKRARAGRLSATRDGLRWRF